MHVLGKVLLALCILGAAGSVALTAKLVNIRNSWTRRVAQLEQDNVRMAEELETQRKRRMELRNELLRESLGWGRSWCRANVNALGDGTLAVDGVGRRQGLGLLEGTTPVVHVFQPAAGGGMTYVGPFLASAEENRSALRPAWKVRPGEAETWTPGTDWQLRTQVPSSFINRFHDLQGQLVNVDQRLAFEQARLTDQNRSLAAAQETLATRMKELQGDPAEADGPEEVRLGLIAVLEDRQDQRDTQLTAVDQLRREVFRTNRRLEALLTENRQLASGLSAALTTPSATAARPAAPASR